MQVVLLHVVDRDGDIPFRHFNDLIIQIQQVIKRRILPDKTDVHHTAAFRTGTFPQVNPGAVYIQHLLSLLLLDKRIICCKLPDGISINRPGMHLNEMRSLCLDKQAAERAGQLHQNMGGTGCQQCGQHDKQNQANGDDFISSDISFHHLQQHC
ncbi:hypothetical protein D3C73_898290 [compost metagenome]